MRKRKTLGVEFYGEEYGLRPNTKVDVWELNILFNEGGMGDFLNYSAATRWVAKKCPWARGRIFVPRYLAPIMRDIHADCKSWQIIENDRIQEFVSRESQVIAPGLVINGQNISPQFLTVLGAHPIDVGFAYYTGSCPAPKEVMLPMLDYPRERLIKAIAELDKPYAVIPTASQFESRRVRGKHINPIIHHLLEKGITPIFLGRSDLLRDGKETSHFPNDVEYHLGIDLRNKTTVKEAACIMQHATMTVGLDCGLLHLAAMMKDSNVIFGYNITTVEHRQPRRNWGRTINVAITENELQCIACQSKLKQMGNHTFDRCLYGDVKCVDLLFRDDAILFRRAIDEILEVS